MGNPQFSIVTPTYNCLTKLKSCIGSVRGQQHASYQHIIQDGASTDGTIEWLQAQKDLETYSEHDGGMYDAINRGWSRASGEILCWLNSDEQYLPGTLEAVYKIFSRHPEVDFVRGHYIVVDNQGMPIAARREIRLSKVYISNTFLNTASCTLFFRRSLWDEGIIQLDDRYRYAADMDMVLRLIIAGKRDFYMNRYLSLFGIDGSNLSCHPAMLDETSDLQTRYGGFRLAALRSAVKCCRNIERLISGSYRRASIAYDYADDDIPTYRRVAAQSIPFAYRTRN